jgi:hypothetical protein
MKLQSLCIFIVFITLFNSVHNSETKTILTGYFFIQKIYGGDDPLLIVKNSQQSMNLKFFTLNEKVLAYSASQQKSKEIEGK